MANGNSSTLHPRTTVHSERTSPSRLFSTESMHQHRSPDGQSRGERHIRDAVVHEDHVRSNDRR